jgi:hypothetical protein
LRHVHDDIVYVVAGRTHPEVVRRRGEQYRDELRAQVHRLGLEDVVVFRNWFHDVDELAALLACSDVFLTPYADAEQIVSGACRSPSPPVCRSCRRRTGTHGTSLAGAADCSCRSRTPMRRRRP